MAVRKGNTESCRKWRQKNREAHNAYQRKWRAEHPGKQAEYDRAYRNRIAVYQCDKSPAVCDRGVDGICNFTGHCGHKKRVRNHHHEQ